MNYKELLNRCQIQPGWLGTPEQKDKESLLKYKIWVTKQEEKYENKKKKT